MKEKKLINNEDLTETKKVDYKKIFLDYCADKTKDLGTVKYIRYEEEKEVPVQMVGDIREFGNAQVIIDEDNPESFVCVKNGEIVIDTLMISLPGYAARMEFKAISQDCLDSILEYWDDIHMDEFLEDELRQDKDRLEQTRRDMDLAEIIDDEYMDWMEVPQELVDEFRKSKEYDKLKKSIINNATRKYPRYDLHTAIDIYEENNYMNYGVAWQIVINDLLGIVGESKKSNKMKEMSIKEALEKLCEEDKPQKLQHVIKRQKSCVCERFEEWIVIDSEGKEIKRGDEIIDFRGDAAIFDAITKAPIAPSSGKINVKIGDWEQEYYPGVFNLKIVPREEKVEEGCKKESLEDKNKGFKNITSQGWKIIKKFKDLDDGRIHVIVERRPGDICVGLGYREDYGSWGQGVYDFKNVEEAENWLKNKNYYREKGYNVEEIKECFEESIKFKNIYKQDIEDIDWQEMKNFLDNKGIEFIATDDLDIDSNDDEVGKKVASILKLKSSKFSKLKGESLIEGKYGFLKEYKGFKIHKMPNQFVVTDANGKNVGEAKSVAGAEGIIDDISKNDSFEKLHVDNLKSVSQLNRLSDVELKNLYKEIVGPYKDNEFDLDDRKAYIDYIIDYCAEDGTPLKECGIKPIQERNLTKAERQNRNVERIRNNYDKILKKKQFELVGKLLDEKLLREDISAVKKNYPNIPDDKFMQLIKLDPTFIDGRDSVGTYGKWILNMFNKGKLDNIGHVKDALTRFDDNKKYLKNKDINTFKSLEDLDAYLDNEENYNQKTHSQEVRDRQKDRKNADLDKDAEKVFSGDGFDVWVPKTYAASCKLGQGSNWCTASTESDYYFNKYKNSFGGEYYILINQSNPDEKYQFHFESRQFMDKKDNPINLSDFLNNKPELTKLFMPKIKELLGVSGMADDDVITINFIGHGDIQDLNDGYISRCEKYSKDDLDIMTCIGIIEDPYQFLNDYYYSYDEAIYNIPNFSEEVKSQLKTLGIDPDNFEESVEVMEEDNPKLAEEIKDAYKIAYSDGAFWGMANEAENDITSSLKECGAQYFDGEIEFTFTVEEFIDSYLNLNSDGYDFSDDPYFTKIEQECALARLCKDFELYEPRYGWSGFDGEAFNWRFEEGLSDLI